MKVDTLASFLRGKKKLTCIDHELNACSIYLLPHFFLQKIPWGKLLSLFYTGGNWGTGKLYHRLTFIYLYWEYMEERGCAARKTWVRYSLFQLTLWKNLFYIVIVKRIVSHIFFSKHSIVNDVLFYNMVKGIY